MKFNRTEIFPILGEGNKIHIKEENKGKFTEYKKRTGKTTEECLHSPNKHVRQMANFAKNASKWHHEKGGILSFEGIATDNGIVLQDKRKLVKKRNGKGNLH